MWTKICSLDFLYKVGVYRDPQTLLYLFSFPVWVFDSALSVLLVGQALFSVSQVCLLCYNTAGLGKGKPY